MNKLRRYSIDRLDPHQTGFVSGMRTSVNIQRLIEEVKQFKKKDGMCMIFVDFKSAYNTVKRDLLYDILSKRNIL